MSMLSIQIAKLRETAEGIDWEIPEAAELLREAADTIESLRERLQELQGVGGESRYTALFGTPERAARTLSKAFIACECDDTHCDACPLFDPITDDCNYTRDCVALLEWLRGDA